MIRLTDSTRAGLAILATFVIGLVVGCGVDRTMLTSPSFAVASNAQSSSLQHHQEVLAELSTELKLSPEQTARVQQIFQDRQAEIEAAWAQVHKDLERAMQRTTAEIETVLDSTQVQQLHAWIAARHGTRAHGPRHHGQ
jgi:hypothetical protein